MRRALALALLGCALAWPGASRAQADEPRVVLLLELPDDGASFVEAELRQAGFRSLRVMVASGIEVDAAFLSERVRSERARGIVRVRADSFEVWVKGEGSLAFLERERRDPGDDPAAAVRAVERLRVALHLGTTSAPAAPPRASGHEAPPPVEATSPRLHLALGPAALASTGGLGTQWSARATAGLSVAPSWRVGLEGAIPFASPSIERASGRAEAPIYWLGLSATHVLGGRRGPVTPFLFASGGALVLSARGFASPPHTAREETLTVLAGAAGGGATLRLFPRLSLRADASIGAPLAPLRVSFLGREEASLRGPFAWAGVAIEASLFER